MIHSMTGYGEASEVVEGIQYAVEVRSLNNRYFKSTLRLPEEVAALEAEVEARLRRRLWRGSITLTLKMRLAEPRLGYEINEQVLLGYVQRLSTLMEKMPNRMSGGATLDLSALLSLPGVLTPGEEQISLPARARPVVVRLIDQACDKLIAMRVAEGQAIAEDLQKQRAVIRDRLEVVKQRAPQVIDEYHQRLRGRIDELMAKAELHVDKVELIREVAIYAERSDISEELQRLSGHLDQFERIIVSKDEEAVGRTLEFLAQEMLREANTIASKSNDATIARTIVEIKGAIDRIKEQSQNVE